MQQYFELLSKYFFNMCFQIIALIPSWLFFIVGNRIQMFVLLESLEKK